MGWLNRLLTPRAATPENPRFSLNDPEAWDALNVGQPSSAGARITRQTALTLPAFWRGINLICTSVAKIPEFVYRRLGDGKQRATEHPAYRLLRYQPIPDRVETTAFDQKRVKMGHVLLKGNGYRYIFRNGDGSPRELLLLDPDATYPARVDGRLWYVTKAAGEDRKLPAEDVLHWKGLGWDGLCGYDVLTYARESLGEAMAKQKYSASFFGKGARPGVIIEVPGKMVDAAKETLLKGWNRMHEGLENAHRTAILDNGAKINQLSIDADKAQLIQSREFSLIDIANILGIPPHKLGEKNSRGFSSLEQEDQNFLNECLDGWLCMIEAEDREKLLSEVEKSEDTHVVEFLREALVRADLAAQANYFRTALGGRPWMVPDEVRGKVNLNPLGGEAAEYLNPLNMGKGGEDNEPASPAAPQPGNPKNNNVAAIAAIRICAEDSARRAVVRISLHARRAAKDTAKYIDWLEAFQAEHHTIIAEMLAAPVAAARVLMRSHHTSETESTWLLDMLHHRFSALADQCKPAELAAAVDTFLIHAEANAPAAWARELLGDQPS